MRLFGTEDHTRGEGSCKVRISFRKDHSLWSKARLGGALLLAPHAPGKAAWTCSPDCQAPTPARAPHGPTD